jgi:GT2 family glycosyltransferase
VIVPTYNAERILSRCLTAISESAYRDFELLVVDDQSSDRTLSVAAGFPCRAIRLERHGGAAAARNAGARHSSGEALLFVDSDIVVKKDTMNRFVDSLRQYPAVFGIYSQKPGIDKLLCLYQNFYAHRSMMQTSDITPVFYSYCAAVRKTAFDEVGGFDESWTRATFEDVEFGLRLTAAGHTIRLNRDIEVVHYNDLTPRKFFRNYFYKSLDLFQFMLARGQSTLGGQGWTHRSNQLAFLAGLAILPCGLAACFWAWSAVPLVVCAALFVATNADFYRFLARERPRAVPVGVLLNLAVQFTAAAGMATGLWASLKQRSPT